MLEGAACSEEPAETAGEATKILRCVEKWRHSAVSLSALLPLLPVRTFLLTPPENLKGLDWVSTRGGFEETITIFSKQVEPS